MLGTPPRTVYAVSELAQLLRGVVEDSFPRVWVQGEISNLSRPASGHWYFTLKDGSAQLRSAMFRGANLHVRPPPQNGDQVLVRAQVSFYTARGDLQLICEHLEPAGEGALLRAFEDLKRRLAAEGLFDEAVKRPIPAVPRAIGLITSATGAAVQDVLTTLARRFPLAPVYLWPVPVQGEAAPAALVAALQGLPGRAPVDVILLVRGGGSLEDLWAFNDEAVARAIRACAVPVISGVGHETDTTIADFAADLRAPTPTAAAERAAPELRAWQEALQRLQLDLQRPIRRRLQRDRETLVQLDGRLARQRPLRRLQDAAQRLDDWQATLVRAIRRQLADRASRQAVLAERLRTADPRRRLAPLLAATAASEHRLQVAMARRLERERHRLSSAERTLQGLSPLAVLGRGYAIVRQADGSLVRSPQQVAPGVALDVQVAEGVIPVRVRPGDDPPA
ncbi:exodeoxyribonuclease VII large subunit [Flagellatimonas centrodinii]|uniref:exodeoxyribonuclease VII large subunit n=1 Tax=Flagellatimonas centrodinii TaxID=2806210 RepID=UPI001FEF5112|nr:exodeoxyribonuclease VII large subunit [Flagellatimonas centrodinii]ULQ46722.1 exodeoxyribonuclease VII large subunit [Flagellatimonas centrodinii]